MQSQRLATRTSKNLLEILGNWYRSALFGLILPSGDTFQQVMVFEVGWYLSLGIIFKGLSGLY